MNLVSTVIGYPYIGENREWKRCVESFWNKKIAEEQFTTEMKSIRLNNLKHQQALGLDLLTVGDFTFYDRMLDVAAMFGLVPNRYNWTGDEVDLATYYTMARGGKEAVACEMTKWFNTNYHYIVPEYEGKQPQLTKNYILDYFIEAKEELGVIAKPTIIGPFTFVQLAKGYDGKSKNSFLVKLLPLYVQVFQELLEAGAEWIQVEEPALCLSLNEEEIKLVQEAYTYLASELPKAKLMLQTYFEALSAYKELTQLPVAGFGLDFVHGAEENILSIRKYGFPQDKVLGIGLINGRDIWKADLVEKAAATQSLLLLSGVKEAWIQSSCSLQHVPVTTKSEKELDITLNAALSFADEKIEELTQVTAYCVGAGTSNKNSLKKSKQAIEALAQHKTRNNTNVKQLEATVKAAHFSRPLSFKERQSIQQTALNLPDFPTTTIGSFPQSDQVKRTRTAWRKKEITDAAYAEFVKNETARWIEIQEDIGLDVLVTGEFERTDMVEYFGEKLSGIAFTKFAWVVSYGSRCVKPPIIYGDVEWTSPMTVKEIVEAQELTEKYVKGMLTGPITILNWSFVRDDISREQVANQLALALREEIQALEDAGIAIIQVDEPALREGLPLRKEKWNEYLRWAVNAFKLATSSVQNETQVHTHMCYCEFNDFIDTIRALDADVISIETSRSHGELIHSLKQNSYELGIGLGVYDIHSPRVPSVAEMENILNDSLEVISKEQFWVNPDCGLKTRREEETVKSLKNMVAATQKLREQLSQTV
ncbi:5-methyltetrahydropteroyltriglutamate--homocysteine S-methyltransferase [Niallia taxi]|uniref:5-methyltetrahydropteroyltriglutamate-- homocysteine S-methyltransferase n=1 Tax=Niallia taxi TaxID=2499688 RepID=UPI0020401ECC|nr:5-methyltetrahydropteroyltriglutamate--homocysteine S-methyltransferase [Niallia taxi]MCM3213366.1 5-methyltetrahydropteroyltriglutamate--homocysteine S-methyltransferase [Niallia taxi]MDK8640586.1 5-methyltetrahydropteroyltriglutamate--homocysteine S-methyltransferase [Niallia taxi]MED4056598.1 5-methyltetrahydropteroyltriglutamate--homocysteine S-methyltransferase [Niallia taxi]MED4118760.1 5-methyltetrahydropteroyltriglutamate--homocysteine S-methyltransferase [Niallia taxi]